MKNDFMIPEQEAAEAAYDAQDWTLGARLWRALATRDAGANGAVAHYRAAACDARAGRADDAFAALYAALAVDGAALARLEDDADFTALHAEARWPPLVTLAQASLAAWQQQLGAPELRRELLRLEQEDQAARAAWIAEPDSAGVNEALDAVDVKTTARLRQIVATHGWPGRRLVGRDGARAAWLLAQHADRDRAFQADCLARLEDAVARGDAEPAHAAYLHDRLLVGRDEPQRYGTQLDAQLRPQPIADEARVDERRRAVGLGTLAEYTRRTRRLYRPR